MKRIAPLGVLLLAACDLPLVMVEVEAPEICVTQQVDVDPTSLSYVVTNLNPDGDLPSEMAANVSTALSLDSPIEIDDNVLDLPEDFKDLLDVDVQIRRVQVEALAPNEGALDNVDAISLTIVPPDGSGLTEKTLIAYDRAEAGTPPGGAIVASGDTINLADYVYAGQLRFKYVIDASIDTGGEPWSILTTSCAAVSGKAEVSFNDATSLVK